MNNSADPFGRRHFHSGSSTIAAQGPLLSCEQDHGYLLFPSANKQVPTDEIKLVEFWPEEVTNNHDNQPWVYWRNNKTTTRERSKLLSKCEEIIKSRQNKNHIPDWVWTESETEAWLRRNSSKLSVEKRYLLKQILKRLRKAYVRIVQLDEAVPALPELKKALITQNAIDKCSRSVENLFAKVEWMRNSNDPVALNFVHKKLIDELPMDMLGIYLNCLIYLKSKSKSLVEQVIEPFAEVDTVQPVTIARRFLLPENGQINYDSTLKISFPPLPPRQRLPRQVVFLGVPPSIPGAQMSLPPPRPSAWANQFRAMGKHELLSQKTVKQMVARIQADKVKYQKAGDVNLTQITPLEWVDAIILALHKRCNDLKSYKGDVFIYGWGVAANVIAQTIARSSNEDLAHIKGVILLGMNIQETVDIDNNLINMCRVPVFAAFGENAQDFNLENLLKLQRMARERVDEITLPVGKEELERQTYFHACVMPYADGLLRMDPDHRINKFALTKQAVDLALIDRMFEFVTKVMGLTAQESRVMSLNRYRPVRDALTDLRYLEEHEKHQETKNKISFDLSHAQPSTPRLTTPADARRNSLQPSTSHQRSASASRTSPNLTSPTLERVRRTSGDLMVTPIKRQKIDQEKQPSSGTIQRPKKRTMQL